MSGRDRIEEEGREREESMRRENNRERGCLLALGNGERKKGSQQASGSTLREYIRRHAKEKKTMEEEGENIWGERGEGGGGEGRNKVGQVTTRGGCSLGEAEGGGGLWYSTVQNSQKIGRSEREGARYFVLEQDKAILLHTLYRYVENVHNMCSQFAVLLQLFVPWLSL